MLLKTGRKLAFVFKKYWDKTLIAKEIDNGEQNVSKKSHTCNHDHKQMDMIQRIDKKPN